MPNVLNGTTSSRAMNSSTLSPVVIGVAEAVRARSLEIPRDIALVCFDDIDYASRFHPFLTAMVQPAETFGTIATQLLLGLMNIICTLSPQRIVLGGGVTKEPTLLPLVRRRLRDLLAGYFNAPELTSLEAIDGYIVPPGLGDKAGVLGAIELARRAAQAPSLEHPA
jgi:hypothetical protein